jgi:hypothetical protein
LRWKHGHDVSYECIEVDMCPVRLSARYCTPEANEFVILTLYMVAILFINITLQGVTDLICRGKHNHKSDININRAAVFRTRIYAVAQENPYSDLGTIYKELKKKLG